MFDCFQENCCYVLALENSYQCQVCFLIGLCNASFSLLSRDSINKFLIAISVDKWLLFFYILTYEVSLCHRTFSQ